MKLSVETYTLHRRYGDEKAIKMLKKAGFESIDYSFYWLSESDETLGENYREYALTVRSLLDESGMTCNQAHAPFKVEYGSKFDFTNEEYVKVVRSIEAAAILGAESIVVHSIKPPAGVDIVEYNREYYKTLEPYCEKFGICIAIENLFWYDEKAKCYRGGLHKPQELNRIIEELKSKWFVVCIDVGHAALTGYEPGEIINQFDNHTLRALHIHDNDYLSDRHTLPYAGSLDWNKIMKALKDIDYNSDFTFEIFGYLGRIDDEFMEEALAFAAKTGRHLMLKVCTGCAGTNRYLKAR
ncbi:MAG: sugar phosphate isomerase/epimerase [Lachnospiraceae bacterium]|nr:sugar phosphate isomerase/epimerase [Lachnospiraceae bacterium]